MTQDPCESCAWTTQAANVMQQLRDLKDGQLLMGSRFDLHAKETRESLNQLSTAIAGQVDTSSVRAHARIDSVSHEVASVRAEASETKGRVLAIAGIVSAIISAAASALSHLFTGPHQPPTGN